MLATMSSTMARRVTTRRAIPSCRQSNLARGRGEARRAPAGPMAEMPVAYETPYFSGPKQATAGSGSEVTQGPRGRDASPDNVETKTRQAALKSPR